MREQYLEHHGIKGQILGKRNGPPYPLDYSDHSQKEKHQMTKTQKEKSLQKPSKSGKKKRSIKTCS